MYYSLYRAIYCLYSRIDYCLSGFHIYGSKIRYRLVCHQLIHGDFVIPRVMGDKLKVHPITILLVLLVMGELFGFNGRYFGIPMYCLVKVTVIYLFRKFKQRYNRFYGDNGEYEHTNFTKDQYLK